MPELKDLTGMRFGRLTVLYHNDALTKKYKYGYYHYWHCVCDCGNEKDINGINLRGGKIRSCGCLHDEYSKINSKTHGLSKTRLYRVYMSMNSRCYNKNTKKYKNYGGRGIRVCKEWVGENGFVNFYNWAKNNGYDETASFMQCTIDRIDNDGDYCPNNCRFTDNKTQANNKSSNHYITVKGETKTLHQWIESAEYDISVSTVIKRIKKGWSDEEALTTPVEKKYRNKRRG